MNNFLLKGMEKIEITKEKKTKNGWEFGVFVGEVGDMREYAVSLEQTYFEKLKGGFKTPKELIKKSFVFLLERETKDSILPVFNLNVISEYFPEYESIIHNM